MIAAILVVGILSGGGVYLANYQPLSIGGMATSGEHANTNLHDLDNSVRAYRYAEGGKTYITVWISNQGRWGVSFTGVDKPEPRSAGMIAIADVRMASEHAPLDPAASTPFRSFSLRPGESRAVMLVLRFGHCEDYGVGASETFVSAPVHFRVLGVPEWPGSTSRKASWSRRPRTPTARGARPCPSLATARRPPGI